MYEPLYIQIANDLANRLRVEHPHDLPTQTQLATNYSVSRITIRKALARLREDGIITMRQGRPASVTPAPASTTRVAETPFQRPMLGLIMADFSDSYGARLLKRVQERAWAMGYSLIIRLANESQHAEAVIVKELIALGVQGLIILPVQGESANPELLGNELKRLPTVIIDRKIGDFSLPFVGTDNFRISRTVAQMLLARGHYRPLFLVQQTAMNTAVHDRIRGIVAAFTHAGRQLPASAWLRVATEIVQGRPTQSLLQQEIQTIYARLTTGARPSCVMALDFASADLFSLTLTYHPELAQQISFVGFDELPYVTPHPAFDRIVQNEPAIADQALAMVDQLIHGKVLSNPTQLVDAVYVDNHSVRNLN